MDLTELHREVLAWCVEDDVGLWNVARLVGNSKGIDVSVLPEDPNWVQQEAVSVILDLMEMGLIEAGMPNGTDFEPFEGQPDQVVTRIGKEWAQRNSRVSLGDICWLRATPAGEVVAQKLHLT